MIMNDVWFIHIKDTDQNQNYSLDIIDQSEAIGQ